MLQRDFTPRPGGRRSARRRRRRDGSPVLAVFAGVAVLSAGTTAAALADVSTAAGPQPAGQCQAPVIQPSSAPAPITSVPSTASASDSGACVSVRAADSTVAPGQAVPFSIEISPLSVLDEATVQISVTSSEQPGFPVPTFTSCGSGGGTQTCTIGLLQAGQATDLAAQTTVPGSAPGGESATLSVTVSWAILGVLGAGSATGAATVDVVSSQPTPPATTPPPGGGHPSPGGGQSGPPSPGGSHTGSPPAGTHGGGQPHGHGPGGSAASGGGQGGSRLGARLGALALSRMPLLTTEGGESRVNPDGLFPRIYPSPLPAASGRSRKGGHPYRATTAADVLPLTMRQVSAQVAGLIVLALGIAIAVLRVPLRRRQAAQPGGGGSRRPALSWPPFSIKIRSYQPTRLLGWSAGWRDRLACSVAARTIRGRRRPK